MQSKWFQDEIVCKPTVYFKWHFVALGFAGSGEQSGVPCHLSTQYGVSSGGQTECKLPSWQNPDTTDEAKLHLGGKKQPETVDVPDLW